jgi:predicted nucleic acid-binding Zn finger protein
MSCITSSYIDIRHRTSSLFVDTTAHHTLSSLFVVVCRCTLYVVVRRLCRCTSSLSYVIVMASNLYKKVTC